jgi:hypothetical protein
VLDPNSGIAAAVFVVKNNKTCYAPPCDRYVLFDNYQFLKIYIFFTKENIREYKKGSTLATKKNGLLCTFFAQSKLL